MDSSVLNTSIGSLQHGASNDSLDTTQYITTQDDVEGNGINDQGDSKFKSSQYKWLEVVCLIAVVLTIICIFLIPTFYFLFISLQFQNDGPVADLNISYNSCSPGYTYTGQVCHMELTTWKIKWSSNSSQDLRVQVENQEELEQYLVVILNHGFPNFNPSLECNAAFRSFICLHSFGVCDCTITDFITRSFCMDVRDRVCEREWREIEAFLGPGTLPVCEDYSSDDHNTPQCLDSYSGSESLDMNISIINDLCNGSSCEAMNMSSNNTEPLNCTELFYYDVITHTCRPMCGWSLYIGSFNNDIEVALGSIFSLLLFSIINILSGLTVQRHTMLKFPSIYIFLLNLSVPGIGVLFGIQNALICYQEKDYVHNILKNETILCSITGVLAYYFILQEHYLMLSFTVVVFWSITFPFNYRETKANGNMKYFNISSLILIIILPLGALSLEIDGFYAGSLFYYACIPRSLENYYFGLVLHTSVIACIISSLLVLITWTIFKELTWKKISNKRSSIIGWTEIKLLVVMMYLTILKVLSIIVDLHAVSIPPNLYLILLLPYFTCESIGQDPNCQELLHEVQSSYRSIYNLSISSLIAIGLFTLIVFIFSTDFKKYLKCIMRVYNRK